MALLDILIYPDPVLSTVAELIDEIDDEIQQLAADMEETMLKADGIGLAANQVNVLKRFITVNTSPRSEQGEKPEIMTLINPEITEGTGEIIYEEGCLSLPDIVEKVRRFEKITIKALDLEGEAVEFDAEGLLAVVFQREIDHLNGIVFIEHLSLLKRKYYKDKLKKAKRRMNR